eukprot:SRR837773.10193.p1 GENE.SRR837773.10193~~SRR837773.10193.p1  ORF type:complete len:524 (-),score=91.19 SRR837773.10193:288-1667(-)
MDEDRQVNRATIAEAAKDIRALAQIQANLEGMMKAAADLHGSNAKLVDNLDDARAELEKCMDAEGELENGSPPGAAINKAKLKVDQVTLENAAALKGCNTMLKELEQKLVMSELRAQKAEEKVAGMATARDLANDEARTMRESAAKATQHARDCQEYVATMQVRAKDVSDKYENIRKSHTTQLQAGVREGVKAALDQIMQSASESILEKVTAAAATSSGEQFEPTATAFRAVNELSPPSEVEFPIEQTDPKRKRADDDDRTSGDDGDDSEWMEHQSLASMCTAKSNVTNYGKTVALNSAVTLTEQQGAIPLADFLQKTNPERVSFIEECLFRQGRSYKHADQVRAFHQYFVEKPARGAAAKYQAKKKQRLAANGGTYTKGRGIKTMLISKSMVGGWVQRDEHETVDKALQAHFQTTTGSVSDLHNSIVSTLGKRIAKESKTEGTPLFQLRATRNGQDQN